MRLCLLLGSLMLAAQTGWGQATELSIPRTIEAGNGFSISSSTGSGNAVLYIIGLGQVLRRDVQAGESISIPAGSLYNAGHYLVVLAGATWKMTGSFDVSPANKPAELSFLAKPSRLPVGVHNGISGTVYVFDAYQNLITAPTAVSFELSNPSSALQQRSVAAQDGSAWTQMDSTPKEGTDRFVVRVGGISGTRVIEQVPGDPCALNVTAEAAGQELELKTNPVRDCSGNAVPDGTIVTFTETYNGTESTADVPLKHGIAQVRMPAHRGAKISVASGVVMGNEFRWDK